MESAEVRAGNKLDWGALSSALVMPVDQVVELPLLKFYPPTPGGQHTIIVFLSDYSNIKALLQVATLNYILDDIMNANARVVFVGGGSVPQAKAFMAKVQELFSFPGELVVDEKGASFRAAALKRGQGVRGVAVDIRKMGVMHVMDGMKNRIENRKMSSSNDYQGGCIVIKTNPENPEHFRPELAFARVGAVAASSTPAQEILRAIGVEDPPAIDAGKIMTAYHLKRYYEESLTDDSASSGKRSSTTLKDVSKTRAIRCQEDTGESIFV